MGKICCIYKASNKLNQKAYIGFATDFKKRFKEHKRMRDDTHFHRALRLDGLDNFEWEILYESFDQRHTLKVVEPLLIRDYNTFNSGYNMTLGGEGRLGHTMSKRTKEKLKEVNVGRVVSEETKRKLSEAGKRRVLSEEHKLNIGKANAGKTKPPFSAEHKRKLSESKRGKIKGPYNQKGKALTRGEAQEKLSSARA